MDPLLEAQSDWRADWDLETAASRSNCSETDAAASVAVVAVAVVASVVVVVVDTMTDLASDGVLCLCWNNP